jgi:hypothetical protein
VNVWFLQKKNPTDRALLSQILRMQLDMCSARLIERSAVIFGSVCENGRLGGT